MTLIEQVPYSAGASNFPQCTESISVDMSPSPIVFIGVPAVHNAMAQLEAIAYFFG
jgi:hypothetical protein